MVPLLAGLGLGASAAIVGTLFGPSQVASRLINMVFGKRLNALHLALISAALIPVSEAILILSAPSIPGAMVFGVIFGMGNGLLSIVSGTLPLALFGSEGYGKLQGRMMAARLVASALAPFALALTMEWFGILFSIGGIIVLALLAVVTFTSLLRVQRQG